MGLGQIIDYCYDYYYYYYYHYHHHHHHPLQSQVLLADKYTLQLTVHLTTEASISRL